MGHKRSFVHANTTHEHVIAPPGYDDATLKLTARGNLDGQSKSQENSRRDGERKRESSSISGTRTFCQIVLRNGG